MTFFIVAAFLSASVCSFIAAYRAFTGQSGMLFGLAAGVCMLIATGLAKSSAK
ncbi:hypothetical protein OOT46_07585 [Aquabacterium sp. A7-Y]|uniref:hypothetical protein n=1 Tax=Aquabacterium sp. A7-Y TaxID=1349605 RepID=UPI00223D3236|nr:hypothetical protein [Aquabacterium sp. A7-Y]MCW7537711.1 hypothetical protein [Aquabacterium sp. A7-Y]